MKKKLIKLVAMVLCLSMCFVIGFAKEISPITIFGEDTRTVVTNTTTSPYSAVCNLTITWSDKTKSYGTGFLISPTRVATVAHCFYDTKKKIKATSITIAPGDTPGSHPYGTKTVSDQKRFHYNEDFISNASQQLDYGYIELDSAFSKGPATLTLNSSLTSSGLNNTFTLLGYDLYSANLYETTGTIYKIENGQLFHKMDTLSGMSGSPILDKNNKVVGINAYSIDNELPPGNKVDDDYDGFNRATKIYPDVYNFLREGLE